MVVKYQMPENWIRYNPLALINELTNAKAAVLSLTTVPYQRSWAENLQKIQLKYEVAGTSRIEGAEFTDRELDIAILDDTAEEALTRSQRQARAAVQTYRWIAKLPDERPVNLDLIREVHKRIITGCDDDHCPPGQIRSDGQNVIFGAPQHRGANGGAECKKAFEQLGQALQKEFRAHDILIQALALHYHLGAAHPYLDGNGRTARAVEALFLQRAGLRDQVFIALSNYYYDEKTTYLKTLSEVRASGHDLTPFLAFGLRGIRVQCERLLSEITLQVSKALFRDVVNDLFGRLQSKRKRVIAKRQITVLNSLLNIGEISPVNLFESIKFSYSSLSNPWKAFVRDISYLWSLGAIEAKKSPEGVLMSVRLEWPTEITDTEFFEKVKHMPKAKTYKFLQKPEEQQSKGVEEALVFVPEGDRAP